jgi:hypothetical protein
VIQFYFVTAAFCLIALSFTKLHGATAVVFLAAVAILTLRLCATSARSTWGAPNTGDRRV